MNRSKAIYRALFILEFIEFIDFGAPRKVVDSASKPRSHYPRNIPCNPVFIVCGAVSAAWMALWEYFLNGTCFVLNVIKYKEVRLAVAAVWPSNPSAAPHVPIQGQTAERPAPLRIAPG